jgi:chemotaxis protein MotB
MNDDWDEEQTEDEKISAPVNKIIPSKSAALYPGGTRDDASDSIWLTSYADLMTLIACFFILLVAFANFDPQSFSRRAQEMAKHFSGDKTVIDDSEPLTQLMDKLKDDPSFRDKAQVKMEMDGLVISFSSTALFEAGEANLKPKIRDALDILIDLIHEKMPQARVLIEGHTDDSPLVNSSKYISNWELSGARAARVVERFEEFGFDPKNLVALGYGSHRPVKPNYDDEGAPLHQNMKENRRVVIKVMKNPSLMKREKMGLGVYFDDNKLLDSTSPPKTMADKKRPPIEVEVNGQEINSIPPLPGQ